MKTRRLSWLIIITAIIGGCGASYQPDATLSGYSSILGGYKDTRTGPNTSVINYIATGDMPRSTVQKYLLYRCAQVTLEAGFDYFVIVSGSMTPRKGYPVSVKRSTRVAQSDSPYGETTKQVTRTSTVVDYPEQRTSFFDSNNATAVIKMYQGQVPSNLPNAYDANEIIGRFGPDTY